MTVEWSFLQEWRTIMNVAAVIVEYNPFHNGHLYQLQTIRKTLGVDYIIAVMSGDFMQRGIPAVVDKYERCRMALENGADLVFELPVYFSLGSADYFAKGAVSLIDKLGVVDLLHFGSECGDIAMLTFCAKTLAEETDLYKKQLRIALKEGVSFPTARARAVHAVAARAPQTFPLDTIHTLLSTPNNILGIEYIKALLLRKSTITPVTLSREGGSYHSSALVSGTFASANALRTLLQQTRRHSTAQIQQLQEFVPASVYHHLLNTSSQSFVFTDDFSQLLYYKLLHELYTEPQFLLDFYDMTPQIANTFYKNLCYFSTISAFTLACKSKNLTYTRISRCLMHILLHMKQEIIDALQACDYCQYARLLGFTKNGQALLKQIKIKASLPIITKPSRALKDFKGLALASWKADLHASTLYQHIKCAPQTAPNELTRELIKHS